MSRPDGSTVPIRLSCRPILDGPGVAGAVVVFGDNEDRVRTEAALRRSEAEYRSLVERAALGIFRSAPDGTLLSVNPTLVAMLGYESTEALMAVNLSDIYVDPQVRDDLTARRSPDPGPLTEVVGWKHRDGTHLLVRLTWRTIEGDDGSVVAFETFVVNVTKATLRDRQLIHSQKMEAIGQLSGGIAHDVNNELSVILLSAHMIQEALAAGRQPNADDLGALEDAARRAAAITSRLLGFGRLADLEPRPTDLGEVVRDLSSLLRAVLSDSTELIVEGCVKAHPVAIDPTALEQSVLNLTANARDALPNGGLVRISVQDRVVRRGGASPGDPPPGRYTSIRVSDNGIGMEEEVLARVFDPFFSTKARQSGTGLGLAMVYGLTHQQGGYVTVQSQPGAGSSFELWFPTDEGAPVSPPCLPGDRPPEGDGETVLVVEDDTSLLGAAKRGLQEHGYFVLTAETAEVALLLLTTVEVDLILSDVCLPGIPGTELLREVEERWPGTPVVLTSGCARDEVAQRFGLERATPYISKPWRIDELLCVIRQGIR